MSCVHELVISLRSDLCIGSGEGFSSGIDVDVYRDKRGIPYIPARRIKGCLRQAAREISIDEQTILELFGKSGSEKGGALQIGNATMIIPETFSLPKNPKEATEALTYVRAQTAINPQTGIVEQNTLRYTRVVGRYCPWDRLEETRFVARIIIQSSGEREVVLLNTTTKVVKALRYIGMDRNRGLGVVHCIMAPRLHDNEPPKLPAPIKAIAREVFTRDEGERARKMVSLSYAVILDTPLMLPQQNGNRSMDYIPGTSVQGLFANRVFSIHKDIFDELILSGDTHFSPLYPMRSDKRCLPATPLISKIKGGAYDSLYALSLDIEDKPEITSKPLSDGFVGSDWLPIEVRKEISYHHATKDSPSGETLYTQECLSAGQTFSGFVECPEEYESLLVQILRNDSLTFGRSKSAQYATCSLIDCPTDQSGRILTDTIELSAKEEYAFILESDLALLDGVTTSYTTRTSQLLDAIEHVSGVNLADIIIKGTAISYKTTGGYNSKWNQKKPQSRVFAAGSTIAFRAHDTQRAPRIIVIGERQGEGYGRIRLFDVDEIRATLPSLAEQHKNKRTRHQEVISECDCCRTAALDFAQKHRSELMSLTSSLIGRVSLSARQSTSLKDFESRIGAVTDDEKRKAIQDLTSRLLAEIGEPPSKAIGSPWTTQQQCLILMLRFAKYAMKASEKGGGVQ